MLSKAAPTNAAGAASTPKINCGDVEKNAKIIIGKTEPYKPYTAGKPAICAYPMDIGIDTAIIMIPVNISFFKFSFLYPFNVYAGFIFIFIFSRINFSL